jgi:hypothetical protein
MNAVTAAFIGGAVAILPGSVAKNRHLFGDRRMRSAAPSGGFYTSSTLFGMTGWYGEVRSGSAAARKSSSTPLFGTPWYGLARTSSS